MTQYWAPGFVFYCSHNVAPPRITKSSQLTIRLVTSDLPAMLEMRTIVLALLLSQIPQSREGRVKRIVGGKKSRPHKYPWQTYIEIVDNDGEDSRCGGTIIGPRHVLTAAHCLMDKCGKIVRWAPTFFLM